MRIVLKKGKQKELIEFAKNNLTWNELGKRLNLNSVYLRNELRNEKRYLSEKTYFKLLEIVGKNYNSFIMKRLDNNWGRAKGGKMSGFLSKGTCHQIYRMRGQKDTAI